MNVALAKHFNNLQSSYRRTVKKCLKTSSRVWRGWDVIVVEVVECKYVFVCQTICQSRASESEPGEYGRKGGILSSISALFDIVSLTTQHNNNAEKFVDSDDDDDITQGLESVEWEWKGLKTKPRNQG